MKSFFKAVKSFAIKNFVLTAAIIAAVISVFFVQPSKKYFEYIDYKTILCLFAMMAVIEACKNVRLFRITAAFMLRKFSTTRKLVLALVFLTFVFSMFIANDMALLTFLPFTYMVLKETGRPKLVMYTIILQNIAANLGGMLTPFGNPQNLYLFSFYSIPTDTFLSIMFPPFALSIFLILICCFFVKSEETDYRITDFGKIDLKRTILYIVLFIMTILMVFSIVPYIPGVCIAVGLLLIADRKSFLTVDYALLFTFVSFFIFTGNLSNIGPVSVFLEGLVQKSTLLFGILSCQFISNVPTAVLFSKFTPPSLYPNLLVAVNLGGMGTLIASLASLISFRSFSKEYKGWGLKYLCYYSIVNFSLLAILTAVMIFLV